MTKKIVTVFLAAIMAVSMLSKFYESLNKIFKNSGEKVAILLISKSKDQKPVLQRRQYL